VLLGTIVVDGILNTSFIVTTSVVLVAMTTIVFTFAIVILMTLTTS